MTTKTTSIFARRCSLECPKCHKPLTLQIDHDFCKSCDAVFNHTSNHPERDFEILPGYQQLAKLPQRQTRFSAGYDFYAALPEGESITIMPGETMVIPTGITAFMPTNEFLGLFIRSGLAATNKLTLQNAEGIIDCDYYGKHIQLLIHNEGNESFVVSPGARMAQGIFQRYFLTDTDMPKNVDRVDGLGHTGREG